VLIYAAKRQGLALLAALSISIINFALLRVSSGIAVA
jgi:hypothetical protein